MTTTKNLNKKLEDIRNDLVNSRSSLFLLTKEYPNSANSIQDVSGLLTCGLVTLHNIQSEYIKHEIAKADHERGKSLRFSPRGIGLDLCSGCFICGSNQRSVGSNNYLNNISAFVSSKDEGEEIVSWFDTKARLDFREHEPNWIQVKIGSCDIHLPKLHELYTLASEYGVLRESEVIKLMSGT